jgi:hypothetical protein
MRTLSTILLTFLLTLSLANTLQTQRALRLSCNIKHRIIPLACILASIASGLSSPSLAQSDSLVDCFPLSTGNSWTYQYYHDLIIYYPMAGCQVMTDSGLAECLIVSKVTFPDSVLWSIIERRAIRRHIIDTFAPPVDSAVTDTTVFDLVELQTGQHELYRRVANPLVLWTSIFPFQRGMPDSARMYRFWLVDSSLMRTFNLIYESVSYMVVVKKDTGLQRLQVISRITGESAEGADHNLIGATILDVGGGPINTLPPNSLLAQNYPNPFNPTTNITFNLPNSHHTTLKVYNILGKEVETLINEKLESGNHYVTWNAKNFPSGLYYYRLISGDFVETKKMVLVK